MKKEPKRRYDESFKLEAIQYYYESGVSINAVLRKYDLSGYAIFASWLKHYPVDSKELSLSDEIKLYQMERPEKPVLTNEELLSERIKALEKALEYSKLRVRAMEVLIDVAEKNEGINIRKKAGAKQ